MNFFSITTAIMADPVRVPSVNPRAKRNLIKYPFELEAVDVTFYVIFYICYIHIYVFIHTYKHTLLLRNS